MKRKFLTVVVLIVMASLIFAGCADNGNNDAEPTATPQQQTFEDDDYEIEIEGIGDNVIKVTKGQIREIAKNGKEVVYTEEQPVYASDKTHDDGNKIPHTLKGVYLDDILAEYANGAKISDFNEMAIYAVDGYETILTEDIFNTEKGGTKMIIVYEYDGEILNPEEKSGALRVVFPDKPANSWAKQLAKIVLTKDEETSSIPQTSNVYITETLDEKYDGSYELDGVTYYGISLKKLFQAGILSANESDQMFVYSWDGSDYASSKSYEYFNDAYLVYASKESGSEDFIADANAPVFNGANILKGMKVKKTMFATVGDSTLVSLKMAAKKLDADNKGEFLLSALFKELNVKNRSSYILTDVDNKTVEITSEDVKTAKVISSEEGYKVKLSDKEIILSSIKVK